ncbi:MAG: HIT domain-containing protein [Candidatus Levybacteria bacterium]|nr:HIT domain-containing protein [Candidatus Levybacteria bacterium]
MDCVFCKIRDRIIPKEFTYEDDSVMVFPDIRPLKPIHLLIIPKKHIKDLLMMKDNELTIKLMGVIKKMIKKQKIEDKGYRLTMHGGGAQVVNHLHIHLMGPLGKAVEM